jgi:hypothetical protein
MCWRLQIVIGLALWCTTATIAWADKRVALVIGNSGYQNAVQLANPAHDAAAIADMFKAMDFEVVELRRDLAAVDMRRVIRDFSGNAQTADVAVVYFAGHGLEVDGENYLIPIDAKLEHDIDVEDEAVSLGRVVQMIEPAKRLRVVILDACRDNPFLKSMKRTLATRAIGRGLARVDPSTSDTLIAFAAKAGSTAIDGAGTHSPFTIALLKNLPVPGIDLRIALGRVRDQVLEATGRKQDPFVYGSLGGDTVSMVPSAEPKVEAAPPPPVDSVADERHDYERAERVNTITAWESFLSIHSKGFFAELARGQLARLYAARTEPPPRPLPMAIGSQPAVGAGKTGTYGNSVPSKSERRAATPDHSATKDGTVTNKEAEPRRKHKDEEAAESRRKHKDEEATESRHKHKDEEAAESRHHHKRDNVEVHDDDDERTPRTSVQHRSHHAEESPHPPMLMSPIIPFGLGGIGFGRW